MLPNLLTNKNFPPGYQVGIRRRKKLDLLVMYNCLMQNVFTQYRLSGTVDYLVAPVSGIGHLGITIVKFLNICSHNLGTHNAELLNGFCRQIILIINHSLPDIKNLKIHATNWTKNYARPFVKNSALFFNPACLLNNNHKNSFYAVKLADRRLFINATYIAG